MAKVRFDYGAQIHDKENDIVGGIPMRTITWSLKQMRGRLGDGQEVKN